MSKKKWDKKKATEKARGTVEGAARPVERVLVAMRELNDALVALRDFKNPFASRMAHWAIRDHWQIALHEGREIVDWRGSSDDQAYTTDAVLKLFVARFYEDGGRAIAEKGDADG